MADLSLQDLLGLSGNSTTALQQGLATYLGNQQTQQQIAAQPQQQAIQAWQFQQAQQQAAAAQDQQKAYQNAVGSFIQNPTAEGAANLQLQFPEQSKAIQQSWESRDAARQQADLQGLATVYSYIKNGQPDAAKASLQQRLDADKAAGKQEPMVQHLLDSLDTDPTGKHALGMSAMLISLSPDGDKFAKTLDSLNPSDTVKGQIVGRAIGHYENGKWVTDYRDPENVEYRTIKDENGNDKIVALGGDGASPSSGSGSPSSQPLSVRLNNPGAIRFDPKNNWQGQVGNAGGFVQFDTQANGQRAHTKLIANQIASGFDTPLKWATHYAPAADGNDPVAYAKRVAASLGIGINDKIPAGSAPKIQAASAAVESGGSPASASSTGGARVVYSAGGGDQASGVDPSLTGQAALVALPPAIRSRVQQLLDGRSLLTAREKGTPQGKALLQAANQVDPTYDEGVAPARFKAFKDFTGNGKAAQVASSGNRLAYHLNDLWKDSKALSGPDLGWAPLSNLATAGSQAFQQAAVARYNAVLPFISGELQKLTKNGTSTEGETKLIMQNLRPNQPTSVREAAIQQVVELAQGQFKPFRNQWESIFGAERRPPVDFTPTTQRIFDAISSGGDGIAVDHNGNEIQQRGSSQAAPNPPSRPNPLAGPPAGATKAIRSKKDGAVHYLVNGQWSPPL